MRVAVVGCGRIGSRRAEIAAAANDQVVAVVDVNESRAQALAKRFSSEWSTSWQEVVSQPDIDAVVVATVNSELASIAAGALRQGKHVLCEKPMGRTADEARGILEAARQSGRCLKVGFNHRHHPGIRRARELAVSGEIGELVAIRAAYGHGGRAGYESEWRCDAEIAGGGELLDQGVHLIDLARWFLGDFSSVAGLTRTWFWPIAPVEDNAFAVLRTESGRIASLHVSWTEWRNLFRFEVLGHDGYLKVEGLGGSYGTERLTFGKRRADWSAPIEEYVEFPGPDLSWSTEWDEFTKSIAESRNPIGSGDDGYAAALIVDALYRSARAGGAAIGLAPS